MQEPLEPEDPMELTGAAVPADAAGFTDAIVQEYLMLGWSPEQILHLFRSSRFAATHRIHASMGEAFVAQHVQRLAAQWARGWLDGGSTRA